MFSLGFKFDFFVEFKNWLSFGYLYTSVCIPMTVVQCVSRMWLYTYEGSTMCKSCIYVVVYL